MKIAILHNPDGTVSVVHPGYDRTEEKDEKGNIHIVARLYPIEKVIDKANPNHLPVTFADDSELPKDRYFRNAWKHDGQKIHVCRTTAESIHMNRLRHLRNTQLKNLDIKHLSVMTKPQELAKIETEKQKLRDLPATFDLSTISLEKLHLAKPDYLEGDLESLKHSVF